MGFVERLAAAAEATDRVLGETLDRAVAEGRAPPRLVEATRYALLGGGKRFRPFLVLEAAALAAAVRADAAAPPDRAPPGPEPAAGAAPPMHLADAATAGLALAAASGGRAELGVAAPLPSAGATAAALAVAAGFECLHCYSLVHDDLPAMDDDDLRRGRPTVHKAFDEATAILVGDGLQALAFELVASPPVPPAAAGELAALLARASGLAGMVGGQFRDLNAAGLDEDGIRLMQGMKTGALIAAACEAGAVVAGADASARERLAAFGRAVGEAFQLADDLLDIEGTAEETGKRVGKDAAAHKATVAALLGPAAARARLAAMVEQAVAALAPFGAHGAVLCDAARFVAARRS